MLPGFPYMIGGSQPKGVQIITNESSTFTVPPGVFEIAAAIVGRGGFGDSTSFPLAHRPGGGARWTSNDAIPVLPGYSIRFRTTNVSVGGQTIVRYEMYFNGVNGNATVLSANSGNSGDAAGGTNGSGGNAGAGAGTGGGNNGQNGTDTNRGGSVGKTTGATNNTTNNTDGRGIIAGADSWSEAVADGWGRGAASVNVGSTTAGGPWGAIIVYGPGKGFNAGPGSYWPNA